MPAREYDVNGVAVAVAGTLYNALTSQNLEGGVNLYAVDIRLKASSPALVGILSGRLYIQTGAYKAFLSDVAPICVGAGISWSTGTPIRLTGAEYVGVEYTSNAVEIAPLFTVGVFTA